MPIYAMSKDSEEPKYQPGEIVVNDAGIMRYVPVYDTTGNVYTFEVIMPKEVFVEAYKKYILGEE